MADTRTGLQTVPELLAALEQARAAEEAGAPIHDDGDMFELDALRDIRDLVTATEVRDHLPLALPPHLVMYQRENPDAEIDCEFVRDVLEFVPVPEGWSIVERDCRGGPGLTITVPGGQNFVAIIEYEET